MPCRRCNLRIISKSSVNCTGDSHIANLFEMCRPFSRLMKKDIVFVLDNAYQQAFDKIKAYLMKPLFLAASILGKPFLICLRFVDHALGAILAHANDEYHKQAIYYMSRTMIGHEHCYNPVKKVWLLSVLSRRCITTWSVNPRHFENQTFWILMMHSSSVNSNLAKWVILLLLYDIKFVPLKTVKEQVITDFRAAHLVRHPLNYTMVFPMRSSKPMLPHMISLATIFCWCIQNRTQLEDRRRNMGGFNLTGLFHARLCLLIDRAIL